MHRSVFGDPHAGRAEDLSPLLFPARNTFWRNPQFLLSVWRPQKGGGMIPMPCSVLVSLLQKPRHRHRNRKPHLAIGFYLFRVGGMLGHEASHGVSGGCPCFLLPVLFTICICLPTDVGCTFLALFLNNDYVIQDKSSSYTEHQFLHL